MTLNLWTEEQDKLLRELCESDRKLSAPAIAIAISTAFNIVPPLTRAAIVGRARRRQISLPLPRTGRGLRNPAATPQHDTLITPRNRPPEAPPPKQQRRGNILPEVDAPGVYLLNAADGDCRRPLTDLPEGERHLMRVCGEPVREESHYCAACCELIYTKPEPEEVGGPPRSRQPFILPSKQRGLK